MNCCRPGAEVLFWRQHAGVMSRPITRRSITLQLSFSRFCLTKSSACFTQIEHNIDHFFTLVIAHAITNKLVGYRIAASFDDMIYVLKLDQSLFLRIGAYEITLISFTSKAIENHYQSINMVYSPNKGPNDIICV